jgi:hypothetical protein
MDIHIHMHIHMIQNKTIGITINSFILIPPHSQPPRPAPNVLFLPVIALPVNGLHVQRSLPSGHRPSGQRTLCPTFSFPSRSLLSLFFY